MVGDKVLNHPNRKMIDRFFINGRTPEYVAMWLRNKYQQSHREWISSRKFKRLINPENIKYQISVVTLEKYRNMFMYDRNTKQYKKKQENEKVKFRASRLAEIE